MYIISYLLQQSTVLCAALYIFTVTCVHTLTLYQLTWRIWWAPNNASKWQMGFNSAFKGLMGKLEFFVHTVVHQSTLCSVACNKLECQKEVVMTYWEMLPVKSSMEFWMTDLQLHIWTRYIPNSKRLCQSVDGVCSCFDPTDSTVTSDILAVWITEISKAICISVWRL